MTTRSTSERVTSLRQRRRSEGLVRCEVYVHPDDKPKIRELAEKLAKKRVKAKP